MKLKAFALTAGLLASAGLLAFGVTNAAWADGLPKCKTNLDGQVRNRGSNCTSKSYKFNGKSNCKCPGDKPQQTQKCYHQKWDSGGTYLVYSCKVP